MSALCRLLETEIQPAKFRRNVLERKFVLVFFVSTDSTEREVQRGRDIRASQQKGHQYFLSVLSSVLAGYSLIPFADVSTLHFPPRCLVLFTRRLTLGAF